MADPKPSPPPATGTATGTPYKAPAPNPALRMMGLPNLPKKLPSRNWLIFWALSLSFSAAVIYDKREKKRATARWARAVSHIAKEPIATPSEMPRKLTVFLESPPTDGLRVAQDHFTEYQAPSRARAGAGNLCGETRGGDCRCLAGLRRLRTPKPPRRGPDTRQGGEQGRGRERDPDTAKR
ncbi:hypothetical protein RRF57_012815 [Xylaria bambusicola]|uniref:Mitochondrial import inner membrane translocase subunit TIM54 n=1 Tax=Xylaria bambusicola TaxID=326684 RepID=A0AAN7ZF13_9PEZI